MSCPCIPSHYSIQFGTEAALNSLSGADSIKVTSTYVMAD